MKLLLLALLPCVTLAAPGLFSSAKDVAKSAAGGVFGLTNDCLKAKFISASDCAILYDDEGCEGWQEPVSSGYRELGWRRRNDAESVVVKQGCTFTGYQHANKDPSKRGRSITVDARGKSNNVYQDFNDSAQLESRISAVDCKC